MSDSAPVDVGTSDGRGSLSYDAGVRPELPPAPLLMLATDRHRYGERSLERVFLPAIAGGVNMVLLREPSLTVRDLLGEAVLLRKLAAGGVLLLVHDRVDVAEAAQADGAHLAYDGLPIAAAHTAAPGLLVGRTVTSVAEAAEAEMDGADYLLVEPVFPSPYAHDRRPVGPNLIRRIKAHVKVPVLASGGITAGNAHQVIASGADGVSVISELVDAPNTQAAAEALMAAMRNAWLTRPLLREALSP